MTRQRTRTISTAPSQPDLWSRVDDSSPVPGDVLSCLTELGITVARTVEDEALALCPNPAHLDRHPSWSIKIEDGHGYPAGTHHCFSCGYRGNMVSLVRTVLGVSHREARAWVSARGGRERARMLLERRKSPSGVDTTTQVNEASLSLLGPAPEWALTKRGFSQETADHYELGWDTSKDCWVAPIRDKGGKLLGWQEKSEDGHVRNYPRNVTKSRTLFGYQQLLASGAHCAVLMEPPLDVARFYEAGFEGGVASYGAGVSNEQIRLLVRAPRVTTIILALDQDVAGRKGTSHVLDEWTSMAENWTLRGFHIRMLNYAHTAAKAIGDMTEDEIEYAVRTSIPSPLYRR